MTILRAHLQQEVDAGFALLTRIPQVKVIQFLDYVAQLDAAGRSALFDALALRAESYLTGRDRGYPATEAFDRYWHAVTNPGPFFGGLRYVDTKMLHAVRTRPDGGFDELVAMAAPQALEPRADLLPAIETMRPATAPLLKKLAGPGLVSRGFARDTTPGKSGGATHTYRRADGAIVRLDFGSRMGQICYGVSVPSDRLRVSGLTYELLWGQPGGWDYLTEENAARSIAVLPDVVERTVTAVASLMATV